MLAPLALVGAGAAMLMRPVLPAMRPLRTGSLCLFGAIVLALAAGTLGVSAGQGTAALAVVLRFLQAHGGAVGQALYEAAHRLVQQVGVDILVVFLFVVGVILLTGASLATVLRATGSGVVDSTRMLRARVGSAERSAVVPRRRTREPPSVTLRTGGRSAAAARAGAGRAGRARDARGGAARWTTRTAAAERSVGCRGRSPRRTQVQSARRAMVQSQLGEGEQAVEEEEAEEESLPGVAATDPSQLTPQGRLRDVVTDDPDFVWRLPEAAACCRARAPSRRARTPPGRSARRRAWWRRSATSACRRR